MANRVNTITDINDAIDTMLAESRFTVEHKPTMKELVRQVRLGDHQGEDYREPKYGTLSAQALARGVDMQQGQKLSDSLKTVTPSEIGVQLLLDKHMLRVVRDDVLRIGGRLMGDALQRLLDEDGLAMLDGFSNIIGSAGTALTWEYLQAARAAIQGGSEPGAGKISGVFHPFQFHPLAKDLAPAGTYPIPAGVSQEMIERGWMMRTIGGVDLYQDGNLSIDSADDAKGGVFAKEALILVMVDFPGIEKEYDSSLRAWEVNQIWEYGWGEIEDAWGREMVFDAAEPTS